MDNLLPEYDHLIEIKKDERKIYIYRLFKKNNKKQLFTCGELPQKTFDQDQEAFKRFAELLGENLLIDSPLARKLLGI